MTRQSVWTTRLLWVAILVAAWLIIGWLAAVLIGAASLVPALVMRWRRRTSR
jgi:hypothetical protein